MHIKHTWQEDVMPKESIQDCIFWHTFTFTCHDTLVYSGHGKSERKPAEGTGNTGPAPALLGTNAKGWMNSTVSESFLSRISWISHFHQAGGTALCYYPFSNWTYFSVLYVSPHPSYKLYYNYTKNKPKSFLAGLYPIHGIYWKAIKLACLQPSQRSCQEDSGFNNMYIYILICTLTKKLLFQLEKKLDFITEWIL